MDIEKILRERNIVVAFSTNFDYGDDHLCEIPLPKETMLKIENLIKETWSSEIDKDAKSCS